MMRHREWVGVRGGSRRRRLLWLLTAGVAGLAGLVALAVDPSGFPRLSPQLPFSLLLALFALAEVGVVHIPRGRGTQTLALAEIPLVLGLVFTGPWELVLARVAGGLAVQILVRRQALDKLAFNIAAWSLHVLVLVALYPVLLSGADPLAPLGWLAAVGAVVVADLVAGLCLHTVFSLHQGQRFGGPGLAGQVAEGVPVAAINSVLGLVTAIVVHEDRTALVLLGLVAGMTYVVYRGYYTLRQRYGRLEQLYEFTTALDRSMRDASVGNTIVEEARRLLRAQHAAVVVSIGQRVRPLSGSGRLLGEEWWRPALEGSTVRLVPQRRGGPDPALTGTGHVEAMAAPLRGDQGVIGALLVTDRLDSVSTFDTDDLRLFEALAAHASVALDNSRLVEQVRSEAAAKDYLAMHDQLTGLPNRLAFQRTLESVLWTERPAGVLLLDLDRFKEVNDTLGHEVGDRLLEEVAGRVRTLARDDWDVARLGGDEFAVLVVGDHVTSALDDLAHQLLRAVSAPIRIADVDIDVRASAGLAVAPEDGTDATQLLRRAEVAMYHAKSGLSSISRYAAAHDPYSPRRLSLAADLERALRRGDLDVHYQPQVDIATRRVVGVEALVRWTHAVHGRIPPDEFVPVAARTGVIHPLMQFVLRTALDDCAQWRARGLELTTSVNLSMRNLLEPNLAQDVAEALRRADVPAKALVLEVTESEIMADPEKSVQMLHDLAALGLVISVDDFGTGHSSLVHLRSLPVGEVKIDRTFVDGVRQSRGDEAIVRSVIELGHNLGLRVVAEGVEDTEDLRLLGAWNCDLAQGYLMARPMPREEAALWLSAHASAWV